MILGNSMQMFEDILYEEEERAITGFINSSGDLEYSIYKYTDGGFIDLADREYDENELLTLLQIELEDFVERNIPTALIFGHSIRIEMADGREVFGDDLDNEIYEINQSILDGNECEEILIVSKKEKAFWKIV